MDGWIDPGYQMVDYGHVDRLRTISFTIGRQSTISTLNSIQTEVISITDVLEHLLHGCARKPVQVNTSLSTTCSSTGRTAAMNELLLR